MQNYQISHGNTYGDGPCFYVVSHTLTPRGRVLCIPQILGFLSIYVYTLCRKNLHFNGHFPDEPRLAGVYWGGGGNWSTGE